MPPVYIVKAPNGKEVEIELDHPPTDAEKNAIFREYDLMAPVQPGEAKMSGAVRGTALSEDTGFSAFGASMRNEPKGRIETAMHTPLADTGTEWLDELSTPANLALSVIMGVKPAAQATKAVFGQLVDRLGPSAAKKLIKLAMPAVLKKPAEFMDLMADLGKGSAKAEPSIQGVSVSELKKAGVGDAAIAKTLETPPAQPSTSKGPTPKELNDAAIAKRRAEYQASLGKRSASVRAEPPAPASPKSAQPPSAESGSSPQGPVHQKLTGAEVKMLTDLLRQGKSYPEAFEAIGQARELARKLGGATPEEVRKAVRHRNQTGRW